MKKKLASLLLALQVFAAPVFAGPFGGRSGFGEGDVRVDKNTVDFDERDSDPATPSSNRIKLYAKDDGGTTKLYQKTSDGTVSEVGAGGSGGAPTDATYIVQTANGSLSAEQALGALATGLLKNTTTTGVLSVAAQGTDYYAPGGTDVADGDIVAAITRDSEWDTLTEINAATTDKDALATDAAFGGDVTGTYDATVVGNDSHAHTTTTVSGLDISDDTNLAGTANEIVLTGDTLSLAAAVTRDTEWDTLAELETAQGGINIIQSTEIDTIGEIETLTSVNVLVSTELDSLAELETLTGATFLTSAAIDTSAELAAILGDETGSAGGFVRATTPTFNTSIVVGDASGGLISVPGTTTTNAFGLSLSDVTLYRSAADTMRVSGILTGASNADFDGNGAFGSGASVSSLVSLTTNSTFSSSSSVFGVATVVNQGSSGEVYGLSGTATRTGTGGSNDVFGSRYIGQFSGTGTQTDVYGSYNTVTNSGTGTITNAYGVYGESATNSGGGTVTNDYAGGFDGSVLVKSANANGLYLTSSIGSAPDVQLYRGGANLLKTPDNFLIGSTGTAVGTSGVNVLAIENGTAPSTSPTDTVQLYATDGSDTTVLMLHFDAADGSTTMTDSSATTKTVTAVGNAQIDTAQSKFGGSSLLLDGTGDYLTSADNAAWDFDTGDYAVNFWVRFNSVAAVAQVFMDRNNGLEYAFQWTGSALQWYVGNSLIKGHNWSPSANTWYYVEMSRSGTSLRFFIDGTELGTTTSNSSNITGSSTLYIGSLSNNTTPVNGWLDDFRILKGAADHTANYTPPTSALPNTNGTAELRVRDEAGNITTLSPHNFKDIPGNRIQQYVNDEKFPWVYRSTNPYIGKSISVEMYGALKALEQVSGQQFIFETDLPPSQIRYWEEDKKNEWVLKETWANRTAIMEAIKASEASNPDFNISTLSDEEIARRAEWINVKVQKEAEFQAKLTANGGKLPDEMQPPAWMRPLVEKAKQRKQQG